MVEAIAAAQRTGTPVAEALGAAAKAYGKTIGGQGTDVRQVLADNGYEPRTGDAGIVLTNCPFGSLARTHTALVCGMNLDLIDGVLCGLPSTEDSGPAGARTGPVLRGRHHGLRAHGVSDDRARRTLAGVRPNSRRNARWKLATSPKPASAATSMTRRCARSGRAGRAARVPAAGGGRCRRTNARARRTGRAASAPRCRAGGRSPAGRGRRRRGVPRCRPRGAVGAVARAVAGRSTVVSATARRPPVSVARRAADSGASGDRRARSSRAGRRRPTPVAVPTRVAVRDPGRAAADRGRTATAAGSRCRSRTRTARRCRPPRGRRAQDGGAAGLAHHAAAAQLQVGVVARRGARGRCPAGAPDPLPLRLDPRDRRPAAIG